MFKKYKLIEVVLLHAVILIPVISALTASFIFSAEEFESREGVLAMAPDCLFRRVTGMSCPTCGLSRAFCSISHGKFSQAEQCNRLAFFWYALFVITGCVTTCSLVLYLISCLRDSNRDENPTDGSDKKIPAEAQRR